MLNTLTGGNLTRRTLGLIVCEHVLIVAAVVLSARLRFSERSWILFTFEGGLQKSILIAVVCQVCLYYADLYDLRILADRRELFVRSVQALGATSLLLAVIYFWFPDLVVGRGVFFIASTLVILVVAGWRFAFEWFSQWTGPRERLLLVGRSPAAVELVRELHDRRRELGVQIVGFVDPDPAMVGTPVLNPAVIGTIDDIPAIVRAQAVDRVVVSLADARGKLPVDKLLEMKLSGVHFDYLASVYERYTGKIAVENLRPSWLIFSDGFRKTRTLTAAKRLIDVYFAGIGLFLAVPIMIVTAIAVKLSSRGPCLYHQQRVGQHGRVFTVHKFRSMWMDAEAETGATWAQATDTRITTVGRFLRRTRLDELPQLWNVLIGDMSLVGPRPERPEFVSQLSREIPFYGQRHVVRPGLTGWAQIRYTYGASVEDALKKLQYRPVLHQEHVDCVRSLHSVLDDQDGHPETRRLGAITMRESATVVNAMTVDVEDYFHVSAFEGIVARADWARMESRVCENTDRLLAIFEQAGVHATFFVLGWVAEQFPELIRRIAAKGHEIASHGFEHRLIYNQTPLAFREDVRRAKQVLESAAGVPVAGFRAPSYSVTGRSLWALDVLMEEGYSYDASIFPIHHDRYGIPQSPRHPYRFKRGGQYLIEVPGSTVRVGAANLPVAGGGYFRILPYGWTRWGMHRINDHERRPAFFYLHPWELDPDQPRLSAGLLSRFRHYWNLDETEGRVTRLLADFSFDSLRNVIGEAPEQVFDLASDPFSLTAH